MLDHPDDVRLYPSAPKAVRELHGAGFTVVVVSNQTVVSRGLASLADVEAANERIQRLLLQASSERIDRFYICPHHPSATLPEYRIDCECRKPRPGLLLRAAEEMDLDLVASHMIGDRLSDIVAGSRAGCKTILVETGMHNAPPIESPDAAWDVKPDVVCADLGEAADWILGN